MTSQVRIDFDPRLRILQLVKSYTDEDESREGRLFDSPL